MQLARVVGTVVATRKDSRLEGKKLLVVKIITPDDKETGNYLVAVDTVDAGFRETRVEHLVGPDSMVIGTK